MGILFRLFIIACIGMVCLGVFWRHRQDIALAYTQFNREATILTLEREGRLQEAVAQAKQAAQEMPQHHAGFYQHLGRLYLKLGATSQALEALKASYSANPKALAVGLSLGRLYIAQKQWSQASVHYQTMLKRFPASPLLLMDLGDLYMKTGIAYRQHSQVHQSTWLWQWSQYYYEQAEKHGLAPQRVLPRLGRVAYVRHEFPQAIRTYCKDLTQGSRHPLSRYYVGMSLLMLEFADEGVFEAQQALHALNDVGTDVLTTRQLAIDLQATQHFLIDERPQEMLVPQGSPEAHHEEALKTIVPEGCLTPRKMSPTSQHTPPQEAH